MRYYCMLRGLMIVLLLPAAFNTLKAQSFLRQHFYISPSVTIGYTFGARVNYGVDIDFGAYTRDQNGSEYRYGFSVSQYYVEVKNHTARISALSVNFQKDLIDLKAGIGRLRNKWGYQNRNVSSAYGFSYDASVALPDNNHSSWLGIKHFVFKPGDWPFFEIPYTSVYLKYKYELIHSVPKSASTPM